MCVRTSQSQTHMCRRPRTEGHKHTRTFCIYSWSSALPSVSSELSVNVSPPSSSPLSPSLTCGTKTPANFKHGCVCVCVFSMLPPIPDWCNTGPITVRCTSQRLIFDADCGFNKLAAGDGVRMCLHNTQRKKTAAFVSIINPSPLKKIMLSTPDPGVFALMLLVLICQSLPWITFKYWTLSVKSSVKRMTSCVRKYLFFNSK